MCVEIRREWTSIFFANRNDWWQFCGRYYLLPFPWSLPTMSIEIDGWSRALHVPCGSRATWLLWRIGWVMTRLWAWFVPPQQPKPHLILSTRPGESDCWLHACSCKKMQNRANIYFVPFRWKIRNEFSSLHYGNVRMEAPTGETLHSSSFKITKIIATTAYIPFSFRIFPNFKQKNPLL